MKRWLLVFLALTSTSLAQDTAEPPLQFEAHEWGVWMVENGRITIDDLAAESPRFVHRTPAAPDRPIPQITNSNVTVRKPVLFMRANRPIDDLRVDVRFVGGRPWLYYPQGEARGNRLQFRGRLVQDPAAATREIRDARGPRGRRAPRRHWWRFLQAVGADTFISNTGDSERFIFYDGPVRFRAPITMRNDNLRSRRGERRVWVVANGEYVESVATPRELRETLRGPVNALRGRLEDELRRAGLTEAETASLLNTWTPELNNQERHVIYLLTRTEYDRMLPITITPEPTELVRVGMVIAPY